MDSTAAFALVLSVLSGVVAAYAQLNSASKSRVDAVCKIVETQRVHIDALQKELTPYAQKTKHFACAWRNSPLKMIVCAASALLNVTDLRRLFVCLD